MSGPRTWKKSTPCWPPAKQKLPPKSFGGCSGAATNYSKPTTCSGKIAAEAGNRDLARAHFGYAFKLGADAVPKRGLGHPLPHTNPANKAFHEAGAELARILLELNEANKAKEVVMQLLALDPTDPLGVKGILD